MKIAFNMVSATHGGGFQTYNKYILKQLFLDCDNNEYYIFTNERSLSSSNDKINLIYVSNLYSITIIRIFWMQVILPIHLINKKIDILFSPMNVMPIILIISKIKKILAIHSNLLWLFPNDIPGSKLKFFMQRLFTNISIKIADSVIVDSKTAKEELINIFPDIGWKTKYIYLGIDQEKFKNNNDISSLVLCNKINIKKEEYFLTISSAVRYHCIEELIRAYEKLCDQYNDIPKYLFISKNLDSKYFNKIKTLINTSKYSEKIVFCENIESNFIPNLYENSSLYIFSSYCEVFGLTNLEAMSSGIPVLTSDKSAMPEICSNAAIYFNPHDPIDIKNKIVSLYYNNALKQEMIEKGYNRVNQFTWENTFSKTRKVILQ
jgi:glycosyltransferase involved in cell wall biosynthesis